MSINTEIKLNHANKIYLEGDTISGTFKINSPTDTKHDGIIVSVEGTVHLQLSNKTVGIFESFSNSIKPIVLIFQQIELAPPGKILNGITDLKFEFPLTMSAKEAKLLYETYHGVFVNINYFIKCEIKRSFLVKSVQKSQQFVIQYKPISNQPLNAINFSISPESLQKNSRERITIPRFLITGHLDSSICCITKPFTGHITIQHTEVAIKSIEVQLVRVETCGCAEGYSRDATEIQNIQIAEGNVSTKLEIPIHMIFPRLFTCPTLISKNFKVEFEVNLVILFQDDYLITENFPIILNRFE